MYKKRVLVGTFLVFVMLLSVGCGFMKKYEMIGTWRGTLQDFIVKIVITSEKSGTITFDGTESYDLTCIKTGDKTFEASYGFSDTNGWNQRKIAAEFTDIDTFIAKVYGSNNGELATGVFNRE